MVQQNLGRTIVAGGSISHRGLRPTKRVRTIFGLPKPNCTHPFIDEAGILTRAHVSRMIDPAWEDVIASRAASSFQPREQGRTHVGGKFELHRSTCLLLNNSRTIPDFMASNDVADLNTNPLRRYAGANLRQEVSSPTK